MERKDIILTLSKSISAMSFEKSSEETTLSKQKSIHSSNSKNSLYAYMMVEAFMNGYVDLVTYFLFDVYTVTVTGNLAILAITLGQLPSPDVEFAAFVTAVTISYFIGCYVAYTIIGNNENPAKSFNVMAPIQVLCLLLVIVVPSKLTASEFAVVPLVASFGMMNTWSNKQGYVPQGMTGNVHRISETLYKLTYGKSLTEKEISDLKIISLIFLVYFIGCIVSVFVIYAFSFTNIDSKRGSLTVILALVPIKYYLASNLTLSCPNSSCFDVSRIEINDSHAVNIEQQVVINISADDSII